MSRRTEQQTAREIDAAAARWAIKIKEHGDNLETKMKFDLWLSGDRRSAGAMLRAEAMLSLIDDALALRRTDEKEDNAAAKAKTRR